MPNPINVPDASWVQNILVAIPLLGTVALAVKRWASAKSRAEVRRLREQLEAQRLAAEAKAAEDDRHAKLAEHGATIEARLNAHEENIRALQQGFDSLRGEVMHQTEVLSRQLTELTSAIISNLGSHKR